MGLSLGLATLRLGLATLIVALTLTFKLRLATKLVRRPSSVGRVPEMVLPG